MEQTSLWHSMQLTVLHFRNECFFNLFNRIFRSDIKKPHKNHSGYCCLNLKPPFNKAYSYKKANNAAENLDIPAICSIFRRILNCNPKTFEL
jgi:hypothetical protein